MLERFSRQDDGQCVQTKNLSLTSFFFFSFPLISFYLRACSYFSSTSTENVIHFNVCRVFRQNVHCHGTCWENLENWIRTCQVNRITNGWFVLQKSDQKNSKKRFLLSVCVKCLLTFSSIDKINHFEVKFVIFTKAIKNLKPLF